MALRDVKVYEMESLNRTTDSSKRRCSKRNKPVQPFTSPPSLHHSTPQNTLLCRLCRHRSSQTIPVVPSTAVILSFMSQREVRGVVHWYSAVEDIGCIDCHLGHLFLRADGVLGDPGQLREGQEVVCSVRETEEGLQAVDVSVIAEDLQGAAGADDILTEDEQQQLTIISLVSDIDGLLLDVSEHIDDVSPFAAADVSENVEDVHTDVNVSADVDDDETFTDVLRNVFILEDFLSDDEHQSDVAASTSVGAEGIDVGRFEDVPGDLICSICCGVLKDPVMTACDHLFCHGCLHRWLQQRSECPIDRRDLRLPQDVRSAPRFVRNMLEALRVRCDFAQRGCETVVGLGEVEVHERGCAYRVFE